MFHRNNPQLDFDRLNDEVQRLASTMAAPPHWPGEAAWSNSLEGRLVILGASAERQQHLQVQDYAALLALPLEPFIDASFSQLAGRLPTWQERHLWYERLIGGWQRERFLLELERQLRDENGRAELPGLSKGLARARLKYLPKVGRALRWALGLLRLDRLNEQQRALGQLQDVRYQALLDALREQSQLCAELQRNYHDLKAQHEELSQRFAQVQMRPQQQAQPDASGGVAGGNSQAGTAADLRPQELGERDFYRALEARFRGSPTAIAELMREHLPTVHAAAPLQEGLPLMDLGCGRGEWLAILREEGIAARGVDLNHANVGACREQGLAVSYQDAISALENCPDHSLGMITSFHLVEHLDHDQQQQLLHHAYRALAPGGKLLLETPNPHNLLVGSCNFYLDPTHIRPLPPDYLKFVAEYAGFSQVEIHPLHPVAEHLRLHEETETAMRVNHYLYGPQDYALVATKAESREGQVQAGSTGTERDAQQEPQA